MALLSAADRAAMVRGLGELWDHAGASFYGVYESAYESPLGMDGARPSVTTDTDLVPDLAQGETVTRLADAAAYTVRSIEPDSTGLLRLILEEQ